MTVLLNDPHHSSGIDLLLIKRYCILCKPLLISPASNIFQVTFFDFVILLSNLNIISLCYEIP